MFYCWNESKKWSSINLRQTRSNKAYNREGKKHPRILKACGYGCIMNRYSLFMFNVFLMKRVVHAMYGVGVTFIVIW